MLDGAILAICVLDTYLLYIYIYIYYFASLLAPYHAILTPCHVGANGGQK